MNPSTETIHLYTVTDEDHVYWGRVGSVIWEDKTRVYLDLSDDSYLFVREEVEKII